MITRFWDTFIEIFILGGRGKLYQRNHEVQANNLTRLKSLSTTACEVKQDMLLMKETLEGG